VALCPTTESSRAWKGFWQGAAHRPLRHAAAKTLHFRKDTNPRYRMMSRRASAILEYFCLGGFLPRGRFIGNIKAANSLPETGNCVGLTRQITAPFMEFVTPE